MTAAELVAAVQPCLPLPGIEVSQGFSEPETVWIGNHRHTMEEASHRIKGAIADACAESRWSVMQGLATTHIDIYDNNVPVVVAPRESYHAHGTDAIAWCKAYAAAMKGGAA